MLACLCVPSVCRVSLRRLSAWQQSTSGDLDCEYHETVSPSYFWGTSTHGGRWWHCAPQVCAPIRCRIHQSPGVFFFHPVWLVILVLIPSISSFVKFIDCPGVKLPVFQTRTQDLLGLQSCNLDPGNFKRIGFRQPSASAFWTSWDFLHTWFFFCSAAFSVLTECLLVCDLRAQVKTLCF